MGIFNKGVEMLGKLEGITDKFLLHKPAEIGAKVYNAVSGGLHKHAPKLMNAADSVGTSYTNAVRPAMDHVIHPMLRAPQKALTGSMRGLGNTLKNYTAKAGEPATFGNRMASAGLKATNYIGKNSRGITKDFGVGAGASLAMDWYNSRVNGQEFNVGKSLRNAALSGASFGVGGLAGNAASKALKAQGHIGRSALAGAASFGATGMVTGAVPGANMVGDTKHGLVDGAVRGAWDASALGAMRGKGGLVGIGAHMLASPLRLAAADFTTSKTIGGAVKNVQDYADNSLGTSHVLRSIGRYKK